MDVGYIRVSAKGQNTARQDASLGFCDVVYEEKISGKDMNRPQLRAMLSSLHEGDVVWVSELSRLGRSFIDLFSIVEEIQAKGAFLKSLKENIDLTNATGVFTFQVFAAVAEFERAIIKERQREGIAQAMEQVKSGERKAWGAKKKYDITDEDFRAYSEGKYTLKEFLEMYGISKAAFYEQYRKWKSCQSEASA